mmetsp:Transcript_66000/g.114927  ORF Transcript_66000/g.114927 Transcript_66000/m.114927 type:complete len:97 (-) Transcript_66000:233-523(-)
MASVLYDVFEFMTRGISRAAAGLMDAGCQCCSDGRTVANPECKGKMVEVWVREDNFNAAWSRQSLPLRSSPQALPLRTDPRLPERDPPPYSKPLPT